MVKIHSPPGRRSCRSVVVRKPSGPYHALVCRESVKASNTSSRGASKVRLMTTSRSAVSSAVGVVLMVYPGGVIGDGSALGRAALQLVEVAREAVETLVPELLEALHPVVHRLEAGAVEAAEALLAGAAHLHQPHRP